MNVNRVPSRSGNAAADPEAPKGRQGPVVRRTRPLSSRTRTTGRLPSKDSASVGAGREPPPRGLFLFAPITTDDGRSRFMTHASATMLHVRDDERRVLPADLHHRFRTTHSNDSQRRSVSRSDRPHASNERSRRAASRVCGGVPGHPVFGLHAAPDRGRHDVECPSCRGDACAATTPREDTLIQPSASSKKLREKNATLEPGRPFLRTGVRSRVARLRVGARLGQSDVGLFVGSIVDVLASDAVWENPTRQLLHAFTLI